MSRRFDWYASLWVVFLLFPLGFLLAGPYPLWVKTVGSVGTVAFAVDYLVEVNRLFSLSDLPDGLVENQWPPLGPLLRLLVCAGVAAVAMTWMAVVFVPYLAALVLFTTQVRTGVTVALLLSAGSATAGLVDTPAAWLVVIAAVAPTLFVVISRLKEDEELRYHRLARAQSALVEREEIARDVHDLLGHSLTVLTLKAEVAATLVDRDPQAAKRELGEVVDLSRKALADIRATVTRLRAPDLASQVEATRTGFAAAGIQATITGEVSAVPLPQRELLAWALREATTNILRHADATSADVQVRPGRLVVVDNGRGTDAGPGNGLTGLRARVRAAGGDLVLTSPAPRPLPGGPGTELEVTL